MIMKIINGLIWFWINTLMIISTMLAVSTWATPVHHTMERLPIRKFACEYLEAESSQMNAYRYPGINEGFCCFCQLGTKFTGDCNPSDPRSTKCDKCAEDEYTDFEPHLQLKCQKKRQRWCFPPKVYVPGTITEADGCKCPVGTVDNGGTCVAVPTPVTAAVITDVSKRDLEATTESEQIVTTEPNPYISSTDGGLIPSHGTSSMTTTSRRITAYRIDRNMTKEPAATTTIVWIPVVGVVFALLVVAVISAAIYFHKCKQMGSANKQTSYEEVKNTSMASSSASEDGMSGVDSQCIIEMDCRYTEANRSSTANEGRTSRSEAVPLMDDAQHSTSNCYQVRSENAEVQNEISPPTSGDSAMSRKQDTFRATEEREDIRKKAEKIPKEENERFACAVASKLGLKCQREDILPMFRHICGIDDETTLNDLDRNEKSTREFLYKSMRHAIRRIGPENLSPIFLWDRVSVLGYRLYTEVIIDEIERCSKGNFGS